MGKTILWPADRIEQNENNRLVTDTQIEKWNNKLENITTANWNNATTTGFYKGLSYASNAPKSYTSCSGIVINCGNLIIQQVYPYDTNKEELIYYVRKGFKSNNTITWTNWFECDLILYKILSYVIKGHTGSSNPFNDIASFENPKSIIFTDINMPSNAELINVDDDGDGGVVAWLDTTDNSKIMYVSTQKEGQKVIGNSNSKMMFQSCSNLTSLDLSNFDTSNVTSMSHMFSGCFNLTSLDLSNFDTSKVTDIMYMFNSCEKLTSISGLSKLDTSNVTNMNSTFSNCASLSSLDLSNFDTSNVTSMSYMFTSCRSLSSLDVSNFDTSNVTSMDNMFTNCRSLSSLDVSNFDTSKVTSMYMLFSNCNIPSLDLSNWNTNKVREMRYMFSSNLTSIKVGNKFKWAATLSNLNLSGTWQDETGTQYTSSSTFPSNVAHTYTKVS